MAPLGQNEKLAINFVRYLSSNNLLGENYEIYKDSLIDIYSEFQVAHPNFVERANIFRVLRESKVLRRGKKVDEKYICRFKKTLMHKLNEQRNGDIAMDERMAKPKVLVLTDQNCVLKECVEREKGISDSLCQICNTGFPEGYSEEHVKTDLHKIRSRYRSGRKFTKTFVGLKIGCQGNTKLITKVPGHASLVLENTFVQTPVPITFIDVFNIYEMPEISLTHNTCPYTIMNGEKFVLDITAILDNVGAYVYPVVVRFGYNKLRIDLLLEPNFATKTMDIIEALKPQTLFKRASKSVRHVVELPIISGIQLPQIPNYLKKWSSLKPYEIPYAAISRVLNHGLQKFHYMSNLETEMLNLIYSYFGYTETDDQTELKLHSNLTVFSTDYVRKFRLMMWLEEHQKIINLHAYDKENVTLSLCTDERYLRLKVSGLLDGHLPLAKGDRVNVQQLNGDVRYQGIIHDLDDDHVLLAFHKTFMNNYTNGENVNLQFSHNRIPQRICHRALEQVQEKGIADFFFPQRNNNVPPEMQINVWFDPNVGSNIKQMQAVKNIVRGSAKPAPYIIFGPPGTGKTVTVVESIKQLYHIKRSKVLVCTPSNSAADLIAERLMQDIPEKSILRFYSTSRGDSIPDKIKRVSNVNAWGLYVPSEAFIMEKHVVISTFVTVGRLVGSDIPIGHFDYLFIDEVGQAMEPEVIIPIAGLFASKNTVVGNVVLAGDCKQLGPIVVSKLSFLLGLEMSFMERLMTQCEIYQKNESTNEFDPIYITKLISNYRSHPAILHVPNNLFYENELVAAGEPSVISLASNWEGLLKPDFPLIFHGVMGMDEREGSSPSYFNRHEIQVVVNYLEKIMRCKFRGKYLSLGDVAIISPYRKQVEKIKYVLSILRSDWSCITVGTVEELQGLEKSVVIISTVRSRQECIPEDHKFRLGFLANTKRFNVAITRAKALLIVVGNPFVLQFDPCWKELIDYATKNNSVTGYRPVRDHFNADDDSYNSDLDLSEINREFLKSVGDQFFY